jgi:hypothetical protein
MIDVFSHRWILTISVTGGKPSLQRQLRKLVNYAEQITDKALASEEIPRPLGRVERLRD